MRSTSARAVKTRSGLHGFAYRLWRLSDHYLVESWNTITGERKSLGAFDFDPWNYNSQIDARTKAIKAFHTIKVKR